MSGGGLFAFVQSTDFNGDPAVYQKVWWDLAVWLVHNRTQALTLKVLVNRSL